MSKTKQGARVMQAVLADMPALPPIAAPVDVTDAEAFPEIARAIASYSALTAERRAQLQKEWEG